MTKMLRVKLRWSGFIGGPGYSIFHFRDFEGTGDYEPNAAAASAAVARVDTFAQGLTGVVARGVVLKAMGDTEVIEDTTGDLVDIIGVASGTDRVSDSSVGQQYAAAAGACINWRTNAVHRGRRIQGRTFLVPLRGAAFEDNGTLSNATITALSTAATALTNSAGTPDLGVYARPHRTKNPDGSTTVTNDGMWALAGSFNIPDMSAVLRSRRN